MLAGGQPPCIKKRDLSGACQGLFKSLSRACQGLVKSLSRGVSHRGRHKWCALVCMRCPFSKHALVRQEPPGRLRAAPCSAVRKAPGRGPRVRGPFISYIIAPSLSGGRLLRWGTLEVPPGPSKRWVSGHRVCKAMQPVWWPSDIIYYWVVPVGLCGRPRLSGDRDLYRGVGGGVGQGPKTSLCAPPPPCASTALSKCGVGVEPLFCLVFWDRGPACARGGAGTYNQPPSLGPFDKFHFPPEERFWVGGWIRRRRSPGCQSALLPAPGDGGPWPALWNLPLCLPRGTSRVPVGPSLGRA